MVRQRLGGWATTVIVLSLLSVVMMIPICLFAKERVIEKERALDEGAEDSYTLRDMAECLRKNKYLLIFLLRLRSSAACLMLVQIGAYMLPGTALAVKKLPHMFR